MLILTYESSLRDIFVILACLWIVVQIDIEKCIALLLIYWSMKKNGLCTGECGVLPFVPLFRAGSEIKHLVLIKRHLSIYVFHSDVNVI